MPTKTTLADAVSGSGDSSWQQSDSLLGKIKAVLDTPTTPPHFQAQLDSQATPFGASADQTVLLSALAAGHELLSSCRNGVCRTCICRLHSGRVTYRMDWPGLSAEEKAAGWFLPCVAYPASDLCISSID